MHVIDDEVSVAHLVCEFLRREGFETAKFTSAAEYIAQPVAAVPDLIITDLLLPGVDGFKLCETVRRHPRLKAVPIIAMTALSWRADGSIGVELMQRFGVVTVLQKPFTKQSLIEAAKKVFATRWPQPPAAGAASKTPSGTIKLPPKAGPQNATGTSATGTSAAAASSTSAAPSSAAKPAVAKPATTTTTTASTSTVGTSPRSASGDTAKPAGVGTLAARPAAQASAAPGGAPLGKVALTSVVLTSKAVASTVSASSPRGAPAAVAGAPTSPSKAGSTSTAVATPTPNQPTLATESASEAPIATQKKVGTVEPISSKDATNAMLQDSARKALRFPVRFKTNDAFVAEYTKNISAGGMFIQTQVPPAVFSEVVIEMALPDGQPPLELKGAVVHSTPGMGFGLQFSRPSGEAISRWQRLVKASEGAGDTPSVVADGVVCVPLGFDEAAMAELWRLVGLLWRQSVVVEPLQTWAEVIAMPNVSVVVVDTRKGDGDWFAREQLQLFAAQHPKARLIVYGEAPRGLSDSVSPPVTVVDKGPTERLVARLAEWLGVETRASIRVPVKLAADVAGVFGQVIDLSVTGVRFAANQGLREGQDVEVCVSINDVDLKFQSRVRWSREAAGQVQSGLSFEQVDAATLDLLSQFIDSKALLLRTVTAVRRKADE